LSALREQISTLNVPLLSDQTLLMPVSLEELEGTLRNALPINHLEIHDQSSGCGENYAILVVSEAFEGKSTLARHRLINDLLKEQISKMHAFSQKSVTPKQYEAQKAKEAESSAS